MYVAESSLNNRRLWATVSCFVLFFLQVFLTFRGVTHWGKFVNPFLLFLSFATLFLLYIRCLFSASAPGPFRSGFKIFAFVSGATAILACFPMMRELFHRFNNPGELSDVLPQLEFQFDRFRHGEMPYQKMDLPHSKPFPVYMPFHWLPVFLTYISGINLRWSGMFLLVAIVGLYAAAVATRKSYLLLNVLVILLPASVLVAYAHWGDIDLAVSLETTIAAFYLLLGIGLFQRNRYLTLAGIICCLLSRYTLVFWLPGFLLLFYWNKGYQKAILMVSAIVVSVFVCYVFPFLLKDPSIFLTGLKYHNGAAEFEWEYGAWSFETGIYFAPHINALVKGSFAHKVLVARICQGAAMLILISGGIWFYRTVRSKVNFYDFSLGMLYFIIVCFYMIGPLTYRYYMITPLMLSPLLCARIVLYYSFGEQK